MGACKFLPKKFLKSNLLSDVNQILQPAKILDEANIMIADDSKMIHLMLKRLFNPLGADLTFASDGQEAYDMLKGRGKSFDLIILDNQMRKLSGIDVCRSARQELDLTYTPVLFLSGTQSRDDQLEFFKAGASDYVLKPFIREEMLARVHNQIYAYNWLKQTQ